MFELPGNVYGEGIIEVPPPKKCHGYPILKDELYIRITHILEDIRHPTYKYPVENNGFCTIVNDFLVFNE